MQATASGVIVLLGLPLLLPVLLAGGLNAQNVAEALELVGPWGLDVCSGLRRGDDYVLDAARVAAWVEALTLAGCGC